MSDSKMSEAFEAWMREIIADGNETVEEVIQNFTPIAAAIAGWNAALSKRGTDASSPRAEAPYRDSTPHLHVGDSSFESWYEQYAARITGNPKQTARDAYAAGMGDPLVVAVAGTPRAEAQAVPEDARDAARYRWLRDSSNWPEEMDGADAAIVVGYAGGESLLSGEQLDSAIDTMLAAAEAPNEEKNHD